MELVIRTIINNNKWLSWDKYEFGTYIYTGWISFVSPSDGWTAKLSFFLLFFLFVPVFIQQSVETNFDRYYWGFDWQERFHAEKNSWNSAIFTNSRSFICSNVFVPRCRIFVALNWIFRWMRQFSYNTTSCGTYAHLIIWLVCCVLFGAWMSRRVLRLLILHLKESMAGWLT